MHPRCIGAVRCGSSATAGAHAHRASSPLHAAASPSSPALLAPADLRGVALPPGLLLLHQRQRRFCSGGAGRDAGGAETAVVEEAEEGALGKPTKQKRKMVRVARKVRRRRGAAAAVPPPPPSAEEAGVSADWEVEMDEEAKLPVSQYEEAVREELGAVERRIRDSEEEKGGAAGKEADEEFLEGEQEHLAELRRPALAKEVEQRRVAPHKLLMPTTLVGDVRPPRTTRLSLNNLEFAQRERLTHVLQLCGIVPGGPEGVPAWKDFTLINHLSTTQWCLERDRFNYLGKSVLERVLTEAFVQHCMENRLPWVQHMAPVTFEVSKSHATLRAPPLGGSHGAPHHFSHADAHEPEVSSTLSSEHARQVEAIFLNVGSLTSLSTQVGLHGLMNSAMLKTLADFTPAEKRNPSLIVVPGQIHSSDPSLGHTNLRAMSNDKVGEKLLALVGSVRTQQGAGVAKKLARHLLFGEHVAEDARRSEGGGRRDVLELAAAHLDDQVLRTSPSKVLAGLHQHMGVEVEWQTEVVEVRETEEEAAQLRASIEEQDRVADSTLRTLREVKEKSDGLKEAKLALAEARGSKGGGEAAIPKYAEDEANVAEVKEFEAAAPMVLENDDEYTLQFDAEGNPIDIRKTSLTYPQMPGPHQVRFLLF